MARSVSYLTNALHVTYFPWPTIDEDGEEYEDADIVIEDIQNCLHEVLPSLETCDRWSGREDHIILENGHCEIAISEYCGLASLSIRVKDSDYTNEGLATRWINQVWEKIVEAIPYDQYYKVGSFSNGEGVFEKRSSRKGQLKAALSDELN